MPSPMGASNHFIYIFFRLRAFVCLSLFFLGEVTFLDPFYQNLSLFFLGEVTFLDPFYQNQNPFYQNQNQILDTKIKIFSPKSFDKKILILISVKRILILVKRFWKQRF